MAGTGGQKNFHNSGGHQLIKLTILITVRRVEIPECQNLFFLQTHIEQVVCRSMC